MTEVSFDPTSPHNSHVTLTGDLESCYKHEVDIYNDEMEMANFIEMGRDGIEIKETIYKRFFIEHPKENITYLYRVKNDDDKFVCRVYTYGDAPFVVKEIVDLPHENPTEYSGNSKYRWYPELINHRLAQRLVPSRTLMMYAAYVSRTLKAFYFVYERGRRLTEDEEYERHSEIYDVVRMFNSARLYHLDTKMSNVLVNVRNEICLHDWGVGMPINHDVPGDVQFMQKDSEDKESWDYLVKHSLSAGPMETIELWAKLCQSRLLFAKIHPEKIRLNPLFSKILEGTFGLGIDQLYSAPKWFYDTHSTITSLSFGSMVESYRFVTRVIIKKFDLCS